MGVDRSFVRLEAHAVNRVEKLAPREHAPRLTRHRRDELELGGGEVDLDAVDLDAHLRDVDDDATDAMYLAVVDEVDSSQNRTHSRDELSHTEGLHDVVVGAQLESDDPIGLVGSGGQDDDRDIRFATQTAHDIETVHPGEAEVENDGVGAVSMKGIDRRGSIGGHDDREADLVEIVPDEIGDSGFVIDDEDGGHWASLP